MRCGGFAALCPCRLVRGVDRLGSLAARGPAFAQAPATPSPSSGPSSSALKQEYDEAFQETMRKPADLDVLFRFAGLATQIGDLEEPSRRWSACC